MARATLGWRAAIQWLVDNDDTEWADYPVDHPNSSPSVTACLTADIFGRTTDDVRAAIVKLKERNDG